MRPQSIVHSMVQFADGAIKAQLGLPDMHLPIRYALGDATRLATRDRAMTLADYASLTFERPDTSRFPCLTLAYRALAEGGTTACTINAANEVAVAAFLKGAIGFLDIYRIITETLEKIHHIATPCYADYVNTNSEARAYAAELVKSIDKD